MRPFLSKYTFKVDRKGRVSVPADYRSVLSARGSGELIAFPSLTDRAIRACGIELMEQISSQQNPLAVFQQTPVDLTLASVPDVTPIPFDGEGRIVLPRELTNHAGITDQATFVGRLSYFEIWSPADYETHQTDMRARLRAASGGPIPGPGG